MNVSINVDIEGNNIKLSIPQAKELFEGLEKVFSGSSGINSNLNPVYHENIEAEKIYKDAVKTDSPKIKSSIVAAKLSDAPRDDKYMNPRVEAARKRAAERTSGCGSR